MKTITIDNQGNVTFSEELTNQEKLNLAEVLFDVQNDGTGQWVAYTGIFDPNYKEE